jgi:hypothetical protein
MSHDLHPEELLTRAASRPLGPDEAADLKAHLDRCAACALQVDLRAAVDRALAPTDADYEMGARAVERLLATEKGATLLVGAPRGSRGGARLVARVALAALMLVGTGVGAAALVHRVRTGQFWGAAPHAAEPAPRETSVRAKRASEARVAIAEAPPPAEAPPLAVEAPPPPAVQVAPASPRPRPRVAPPPAPPEEAPAPTEPAPPPVAAPSVSPAARLFQEAERARRSGDAAGAERLYARLTAEFRDTREEVVGRALRGQLLADDLGRPAEGLAAFDEYLRAQPRGVLAEEARAGRAEALGRLGRRREEGAAWRDLLASHPRSIYAARARERLAALAEVGD